MTGELDDRIIGASSVVSILLVFVFAYFSALLPNTIIYDPTTTPRTPFPGNVIPANRLSPIARQLAALYPRPTTGA